MEGCVQVSDKAAAVIVAAAVFLGWVPSLSAASADEGIRPVGVDGQDAFWNAHAERFMYPPQFGFAAVDGAERYRFKVITDAHYLKWSVPGVLEQYRCYVPIDSAAAKVMRTCLAVHRATGEAAYLAKARALADSLVAMQQPSGRIQTFWRETPEKEPLKNDWINCMIGSADALAAFAEYVKGM